MKKKRKEKKKINNKCLWWRKENKIWRDNIFPLFCDNSFKLQLAILVTEGIYKGSVKLYISTKNFFFVQKINSMENM